MLIAGDSVDQESNVLQGLTPSGDLGFRQEPGVRGVVLTIRPSASFR